MNENMAIWESVKAVPKEAQKPITGGRLKGMTDIKPQWRLMVLTETFGPVGIGWYYETIERWTDEHANTVSAHVRVNLYVKHNGEWSKPIEGQGGSMLLAQEKNGPYHSDEAYKMATTDALSVACKELGIGADVYMGYSTSKYPTHQQPSGGPQRKDNTIGKWVDAQMKKVNQIPDDGHRADLAKRVSAIAKNEDHGAAEAIMKEIDDAVLLATV